MCGPRGNLDDPLACWSCTGRSFADNLLHMTSFLRRIPPDVMAIGLYLLLIAFAIFAWRNAF